MSVPPGWHRGLELPNTCPHCGATPCLPMWRKLTLGPAATARCRTCGFRVAVSPAPAIAAMAVPGAVLILVVAGMLPVVIGVLAVLAGLAVCVAVYVIWVPLFRADLSNDRVVAAEIQRIARGERG